MNDSLFHTHTLFVRLCLPNSLHISLSLSTYISLLSLRTDLNNWVYAQTSEPKKKPCSTKQCLFCTCAKSNRMCVWNMRKRKSRLCRENLVPIRIFDVWKSRNSNQKSYFSQIYFVIKNILRNYLLRYASRIAKMLNDKLNFASSLHAINVICLRIYICLRIHICYIYIWFTIYM